jgi:hypothetical protein
MKDHSVESFECNGLQVGIYQDTYAESPLGRGDENLFLITTSNRYFEVQRDGFSLDSAMDGGYNEEFYVFPLFAYIHSGVALSLARHGQFSDMWDSGQIGFVFVSKKEWSGDRSAYEAAEALVEEWNQYLSGDVYSFVVSDENGDHLESCCGIYGLQYCIEEAKDAANAVDVSELVKLDESVMHEEETLA